MSDAITRLNAALEGRYRIERELGEGGMATVYLADDLKHERKVALKVLKPELAAVVGAERFLTEIKTTANLQHPHILPLFDSGEADRFLFYVMPYVEGETLGDRLDREHQLPVEEALRIATNVAEALDYAHRHDVIHRDIKPANILLQDGKPVVSDFGIALALGAAGDGRLTETGLSLGTPHYMSPEQATGDLSVGAATDIYALGCVLYEMLVGEPPYTGSTPQAILGKIISGDLTSATKQRASVPGNVDAALRKALERVPADRFSSARELAVALADPGFRYGDVAGVGDGRATGPWNRLSITLALVAALTTAGLGWSLLRPESPARVTRLSVRFSDGQEFAPGVPPFDISADGSLIVYRGGAGDVQRQLWVRRWDALEATPIRGTEGASSVALSPSGDEVAFRVSGALRVMPLQGGVGRTLAEGVYSPRWSPDGAWIYYASPGGIRRVPAAGGSPESVTELDTALGETANAFPLVLPNGQGMLYTALGPNGALIRATDGRGEVKTLTPGSEPMYSPTGHVLFLDDEGTLLAAPFDARRLELAGAAVPIAEGLVTGGSGGVSFALSSSGMLAYRTGGSAGRLTPVWVERGGTEREIDPGWEIVGTGNAPSVSLSPTGDRLAISGLDDTGGVFDLWIKRLDSGPLSRFTFEGSQNMRAHWSPDGETLTFPSDRQSLWDLWSKRADGSGTAELVLDRDAPLGEGIYSPDGAWLVFREGATAAGQGDIYAMRTDVDSAVVELSVTEFNEYSPAISPDGRWLAYVSDESGPEQVYVMPFPQGRLGGGLVQVSISGGRSPVWAHNGRELFYRNRDDEMVVAEVRVAPTFSVGEQDVLFSTEGYFSNNGHPMYDVTPDDQRFVMLRSGEVGERSELILVQNFHEELRRLVPN